MDHGVLWRSRPRLAIHPMTTSAARPLFRISTVVGQLGALVRSRAAERSFTRGRAIKQKSRPATAIREDPPGIHRGSHFWDPGPLGCSRKNHRTRTADGKWEMTGSNTPWAQGPANFAWCISQIVGPTSAWATPATTNVAVVQMCASWKVP